MPPEPPILIADIVALKVASTASSTLAESVMSKSLGSCREDLTSSLVSLSLGSPAWSWAMSRCSGSLVGYLLVASATLFLTPATWTILNLYLKVFSFRFSSLVLSIASKLLSPKIPRRGL